MNQTQDQQISEVELELVQGGAEVGAGLVQGETNAALGKGLSSALGGKSKE